MALDMDIPTSDLAQQAMRMWEGVTGTKLDQQSFRFGDLDLYQMNKGLKESLDLDPEGVTTLLLLEVYLRAFLEEKTFTAASIMRDYSRLSVFLKDAEALFSLLQSDRLTEISAGLRRRVSLGLERYGATGENFDEAVADPDLIPFLRRDAQRSMRKLGAFQFLDGPKTSETAQAFHHIYIAYDVNELLASVRDMNQSGVAVVLMRDPSHADRSYFTFAMRNGGKVILLTDKSRPVYPGQGDVLSRRGGRGLARSFASRSDSNHFPYQIIPTSFDEKGDVVFEKETAPVSHGPGLLPLMPIAELPAHQGIWITMMLSLIQERFWKEDWRAEELCYTGTMITDRMALIRGGGQALARIDDYKQIDLEPVQLSDLTSEAMKASGARTTQHRVNAWIEARYRDRVDAGLLNLKAPTDGSSLLLAAPLKEQARSFRGDSNQLVPVQGEVFAYKASRHTSSWSAPAGYPLIGMADSEFGTKAELAADRLFVARRNMASALQRLADEEFHDRKGEIEAWFKSRVENNLDGLFAMLRSGEQYHISNEGLSGNTYKMALIRFDTIKSETFRHAYSAGITLGERDYRHNPLCVLTEAKPTYRALFTPYVAANIAQLAGCEVDEMPEVIQNWARQAPYVGNHLLDRIDPVEANIHDPWHDLTFEVNLYLSKRGHKTAMSSDGG